MTTQLTVTGPAHADERTEGAFDVVTGAFSYSGQAIAAKLLTSGRRVRTLTGHPERRPDDSPIDALPLDFDNLPGLVDALTGAETLYNTYWVRFAHGATNHDIAVANSRALFNAAKRAGVKRVVHVSITHPAINSPFPYFRGKAHVERALAESGLSYSILRPAILFGGDGVLINNIAWLLRHIPVFAIGGRGDYRIRGIHVGDLAQLAIIQAQETRDSIIDAVGPDRPTFAELVDHIRTSVDSRSRVLHVPNALIPLAARVVGRMLGDVLLTKEEYGAMSAGLADTDTPTTGSTSLMSWICDNANTLGREYAHELRRHYVAVTDVPAQVRSTSAGVDVGPPAGSALAHGEVASREYQTRWPSCPLVLRYVRDRRRALVGRWPRQ